MSQHDVPSAAGAGVFPVAAKGLGSDVRCHALHPDRPPLFIEPRGDGLRERNRFFAWVEQVRPALDGLIAEHGAIVLRGFPTPDTGDFRRVSELFPAFEAGYSGGASPRRTISGNVMEATRLAPSLKIGLHSEMAYMRDYPKRIAFFCRQAATTGGETIIGDMRDLVEALPAELVEKIERLGVRNVRNFEPRAEGADASVGHPDLTPWNLAFATDDPAQVEAICAERGLEPEWRDNGALTVFNDTQPFVVHPQTGRKLYRSIVHVFTGRRWEGEDAAVYERVRQKAHPSGTFLGNGEPLSAADVKTFRALIDARTYSWPWRNGDIMIVDNLQIWHGRNPYEGPREVQVALLDA
jgi:alpha-ketoglutarate-dependent taurine dioxygenase